MCCQYFMVYEWCRCEEDAGQQLCSSRNNENNYCPETSIQLVHMHCFCYGHATHGFKSERKLRKQERKQDRKRFSMLSFADKSDRSDRSDRSEPSEPSEPSESSESSEQSLPTPRKKRWSLFASLRSRTF